MQLGRIDWMGATTVANTPIRRLRRGKTRLVLAALVPPVLVWAGLSVATPQFQASALVEVTPEAANRPAAETRLEALVASQGLIMKSNEVLEQVALDIGPEKLLLSQTPVWRTFGSLRHMEFGGVRWIDRFLPVAEPSEDSGSPLDRAIDLLQRQVVIHPEARTDVLSVSYKNANRDLARAVIKALVQAYISRKSELAANANAAGLNAFSEQRKKYELAVAAAHQNLSTFERSTNLYATDVQKRLSLSANQQSRSEIADTIGKLAQREAEAAEFRRQLQSLRLTSLASQIGTPPQDGFKSLPSDGASSLPTRAGDPPLLLVRVYQETAQQLVQKAAEVAGLRQLLTEQKKQESLQREGLDQLAANEVEHARLEKVVELAQASVDALTKREAEQVAQLSLDRARAVQVSMIQEAAASTEPVFPTVTLKLLLAALAGALSILLAATSLIYSRPPNS